MNYKILVVDDETSITDVCKRYLEREGYTVIIASDGIEAIDKWKAEKPDLIVLDLMMPKKDGWKVCEEIRNEDEVPIIMLTARGEDMDRVMGLTIGANDYVTKPFSPRELVLRIKSIFRLIGLSAKQRQQNSTDRNILIYGRLKIDPKTRTILIGDKPVELTMKEFDVLLLLASHPQQVFSRSQILDKVWDMDFEGDTTTVTVHIRRLREKIEVHPSQPQYLKTVWGIGYKFESEEQL